MGKALTLIILAAAAAILPMSWCCRRHPFRMPTLPHGSRTGSRLRRTGTGC